MDSDTRKKVEAKVLEILRAADLDSVTELNVREMAAETLGIDLSDIVAKNLVREVVEAYLISSCVDEHQISVHDGNLAVLGEARVDGGGLKIEKNTHLIPATDNRDDGIKFLCKLSNRKSLAIKDSAGEKVVLIGEFVWKDGKRVPGSRGIGLPAEQWMTIRKNFAAIEEAIEKVKSRMRCEPENKQKESAQKSAHQPRIAEDGHVLKKQKPDTSSAEEAAQKEIKQKPAAAATTNTLNPIVMVRFDGKNYHDWARRIEPFLEQLKLAYVLVDPCPTANTIEVTKKWMNDDYMCRTNILSSLSDHLFDVYSKKEGTAKELWNELKLLFLTEEHGSKVSLVKKYMEYVMVEGKSVFSQTQELHQLADLLSSHGMHVQECFHVNAIISKFPASWKDVGVKLMMDNTATVQMLMNSLKQEEDLRRRGKRGAFPAITPNDNDSMKGRRGLPPLDRERKLKVCSICQKKGHSEEKCWFKKSQNESVKVEESDQK